MVRYMFERTVQGMTVPAFLYGTAWKEDETEELTGLALGAGFRGIDTANQRRHYFEAAVGKALAKATAEGLEREQLFLQTKFTFADGQDHRIPYDPAADFATQVGQSFASSLEHLGTDHVDSYVLHGPSSRHGLGDEDWEVWRAMEALRTRGKTRLLGVSNVSLEQLVVLHRGASVKPAFVQNRCFASMGWDREVRAFCAAHGIVYQGFSLLTANRPVLRAPSIGRIAERVRATPEQVVFRFALEVGMLPLTGTSDVRHMQQDLASGALALTPAEVQSIEHIAG